MVGGKKGGKGPSPLSKEHLTANLPAPASSISSGVEVAKGTQFKVSQTVKVLGGSAASPTVDDASLADILARSFEREDVREPDTPLHGTTKGGANLPRFPTNAATEWPAHVQTELNADSIITPHTYHAFKAGAIPPRKSPLGHKLFNFLKSNWNGESFNFESDPAAVRQYGADVIKLCAEIGQAIEGDPLMLRVPANCFVFGDMHGNFSDLNYFLEQLILFNDVTMTPHNFLCLGDYVDRGKYSLECVMMMFAMKAQSPGSVYMLRGNHEDPNINGDVNTYGDDCFQSQCKKLFGDAQGMEVWNSCNAVFRQMPLAATVGGKVFCSHGGIPRYFGKPEEDDRLKLLADPQFPKFRSLFEPLDFTHIPKDKMERFWVIAFDLMWSDPSENDHELNQYGFGQNDRGNCIITFGEKAVDDFISRHGFQVMFRAHQEKSDGLKISKSAKCLTIFTSSNYQGHGNGAGVAFIGANGQIQLIIKDPIAGTEGSSIEE